MNSNYPRPEGLADTVGSIHQTFKPPQAEVGLMPYVEWQWNVIHARYKDIEAAMARYSKASMVFPVEWAEELLELKTWVDRHDEENFDKSLAELDEE